MKKRILAIIFSIVLIGVIVLITMLVRSSKDNNEVDNCTGNISADGRLPQGTFPTAGSGGDIVCYKPVIYLYPEIETAVTVQLDLNGRLTHTYPVYNNGWKVTAKPDGTLTDETGRDYYCLFWEGEQNVEYDMSKGFVVAGSETAAFLEEKLAILGLTEKEANEFIIYWLPQMENNAYNLIAFQGEVYTGNAKLSIMPEPDSVLRVFMAWQALDEKIEVEEQELHSFERKGFTVVEWGAAPITAR